MELYTLSSRFMPKDSIGQFTSAIWTERYSSAGDVQLVVQPFPSMIDMLKKGTLLGLRGTKEVMQIETQELQNGLLTVTGSSLPHVLNQRPAWFHNPAYDGTDTSAKMSSEYTEESITAGRMVSNAVEKMVINPVTLGTPWATINLDWAREKIQGLELGVVDNNGAPKRLTISVGQLYDSIQSLAQEEGLGIKLYLERASWTGTYTLKFATYRGKDRTSDQTSNLLIRLSPKLDSLLDVKEINSLSQYKNVFYVVYKNQISTHYIPGLPIPEGFDRRSLVVEAPDIFFDSALPGYDAKVAAFREQVARNTIANHVYIQSVDGQISQQIGYTFGDDYYLGDIIELEGFTGVLAKARVTEYIRSQDQFGAQEYPTLAVLDPLFTGYMPDLEPNSDFDPDWTEDPDFDFDFDTNNPAKDPRNDPETRPPTDRDPRDPIDHNPDPEHVFPTEDGGSSGYDEAYVGGNLEIHPDNYIDDTRDRPAWYQHHDRIYLEGYLIYGFSGDPGGMVTTAGGVPEEARPATTVTVTVYPDMPDSDSLYGHFTTFTGTITPAGTITISPIPPTYDEGFALYLLLANISWPVNPPVDLGADTVESERLTPWLTQHLQFSDPQDSPTTSAENATIGGHGTRVHLGGKVTLAPGFGNLIQNLPEKYRAPHNDSLAIPGGGGWYSSFIDKAGYLTFKQQKSKPLLRAVNLTDWRLGTPWVYGEELTNEGIGPLEFWGGPAPEAPMYLSGRWTPPVSNAVGDQFGFTITYSKTSPDGGQITYKLGAMKMGPEHNNEWWMMLEFWRIFLTGDPETTLEQGQMPMGRLDSDGPYQGMLPNGVNMFVSIQPFGTPGGVPHIQIATNISGTKYGFELPQQPNDIAPVWPSQIGATNGWGAFYSLAGGQPVSTLTNITADYFSTPSIAPNGEFYPPNWLPNHGYVDGGYEFDLDHIGWRVPPIPPTS